MREFARNAMRHLEEYYRRSNPEAGFAADRKMLGGTWLRGGRTGRGALFCTGLWKDLFNFDR